MKLTEEIKNNENEEISLITIQGLQCLAQIEFAVRDHYLRANKEVQNVISIISDNLQDQFLEEVLLFLIIYLMNSYNQDYHVNNFAIFNVDDNIHEILYNIFETQKNEEIKFLIACFFLSLSILEDIWIRLKNLNMIKSTTLYIQEYIYKTYNKTNKYSDTTMTKRTKMLDFLIKKILFCFCKTKNYKNIYHVDLFSNYFNVVSLLFYIFDPRFRNEILTIFNIFTYFYDCKYKVLNDPQNSRIISIIRNERLPAIYNELIKAKKLYIECKTNLENFCAMRSRNIAPEFVIKLDENIGLIENNKKQFENHFTKTTEDFVLFMSIFVNLMMYHDYKSNISKVCDEGFFQEINKYDLFFEDNALDFTEKKQGIYSKHKLQIKLAKLIFKPEGKKRNKSI
jgi:hypothetical protein